jgi:hypothetical protein
VWLTIREGLFTKLFLSKWLENGSLISSQTARDRVSIKIGVKIKLMHNEAQRSSPCVIGGYNDINT